jgi:hypothetical protein
MSHVHWHEERIHTEPVVLDIGGTVGALIIYTDPSELGREIELSPRGRTDARFHNQVHQRSFNGRTLYAAVYPDVHEGDYVIWGEGEGEEPTGTVTVRGGEVATLDWRSSN